MIIELRHTHKNTYNHTTWKTKEFSYVGKLTITIESLQQTQAKKRVYCVTFSIRGFACKQSHEIDMCVISEYIVNKAAYLYCVYCE